MPVPSLITDLSTVAASNSPAGSDAVFPDLDNYIRALSSFIAQNYTNKAPLASPTFTGTVTAANLTTTGNTILGDGVADTFNLGAGGLIKNASNEFGVNCTPVASVALRVQSPGSNDVGVEWVRTAANEGYFISYNRSGAAYTNQGFNALAYSWKLSDVVYTQLDTNAWYPTTTNQISSGKSGNRWSNVYGVLGNFSGQITASGGIAVTGATSTGTLSITQGAVISGTYTPTLTSRVNVAASTPTVCQYIRVGNVVTVSGNLDVDPTSLGAVGLGVSLPIASDFASMNQLGGTGLDIAATQASVWIADAANNRADMSYTATSVANQTHHFSFTYLIV